MSRVRNQRTGKWIELPDSDGLQIAPGGRLITHEQRKAASIRYMGGHDFAPVEVRWAANQWGNNWLHRNKKDRLKWQHFVPMLRTDITLNQFRVVGVEDALADLLGL